MHAVLQTEAWAGVLAWAKRADFPSHAVVVRPLGGPAEAIRKGLATVPALEAAFAWAAQLSPDGQVQLETDMRAHMNPTRMALIGVATRDLVKRMSTLCPQCESPGFGVGRKLRGLPCEECGTPTKGVRAHLMTCVACEHQEEVAVSQRVAAADRCPVCNVSDPP
jgi:hypothetical protein